MNKICWHFKKKLIFSFPDRTLRRDTDEHVIYLVKEK